MQVGINLIDISMYSVYIINMSIKQLKNRVKKLKPSKRQFHILSWDNQDPPPEYNPEVDLLVIIDLDGWSKEKYGDD